MVLSINLVFVDLLREFRVFYLKVALLINRFHRLYPMVVPNFNSGVEQNCFFILPLNLQDPTGFILLLSSSQWYYVADFVDDDEGNVD